MANNDDFLTQFDGQLSQLDTAITAAVESNNARNNTFSRTVIESLTDINNRIGALAQNITQLKTQLTSLQTQIQGNTGQIQNNDAELIRLQEANTQLTSEKASLETQINNLNQTYNNNTQLLESQKNTAQEQLRQLQTQHTNLNNQIQTLENELRGRGDLQNTHATAISDLTNAHNQQLETQRAECNRQIQELQNQITERTAEIERVTQELNARIGELQTENQRLSSQITGNDTRMNELQSRIDVLEEQNRDLSARIVAATDTIRRAIASLSQFNNTDAFNNEEKDRILLEITNSITNINNIINGTNPTRGVPPPPPMQGVPSPIQGAAIPPMQALQTYTINGNTYDKTYIINLLKDKKRQLQKRDPNNKYAQALNQLQTSNNDINDIFRTFNITFKNNNISGGKTKKRQKYKKHRGGFTYKHNAKRKTFSTTLNIAKGSSKKTSKRFKK